MSCLAPARTDPGAAAGLARFGPQSPDFSSYPGGRQRCGRPQGVSAERHCSWDIIVGLNAEARP